MKITQSVVTVAAAGTPVRVTTDTDVVACAMYIQNMDAGYAYVGTSAGMDASTFAGVIARKAQDEDWSLGTQNWTNSIRPSDYWIDAASNGAKVLVTLWEQ